MDRATSQALQKCLGSLMKHSNAVAKIALTIADEDNPVVKAASEELLKAAVDFGAASIELGLKTPLE